MLDFYVAFAHPVVVADHYASDGAEEDGVCAQIYGELVRAGDKIPGTDTETDYRAEIASASDVDVAREQRGQVSTSGDRVSCDVSAELR